MSPRIAHANSTARSCRFNDCKNMAVHGTDKCSFHKNRRQCIIDECTNQVYARKLCVRHGGKKQCLFDGCEAHARGGGYCLQHGGFSVKRFCTVDGCKKQAHARQKCVRHGGGRRCRIQGCMQHARAGGICNRHSHDHKCRIDGCVKVAQHLGAICFHHAMELRAEGKITSQGSLPKSAHFEQKEYKCEMKKRMLKVADRSPKLPPQSTLTSNGCFDQPFYPNPPMNVSNTMCANGSLSSYKRIWSEPLLPSMEEIPTSSNLVSPFVASSSLSKPRSSHPSYGMEAYPTHSHLHLKYKPSSACSVADVAETHYHHRTGEDDLECILNSYSRLISPAGMSYSDHTSGSNFYGNPRSSSIFKSAHDKYMVTSSTTSAPALVRLDSLLPPAPGIITGHIPLDRQYEWQALNSSS